MGGASGKTGEGKRLGQILVDKGYITEAQLAAALEAQAERGDKRLIGQILVSRGYVKSPHVQIALAAQQVRDR